jgi:hypothetical protein
VTGRFIIERQIVSKYAYLGAKHEGPPAYLVIRDDQQLDQTQLQQRIQLCPKYAYHDTFDGILQVSMQ